MNSSLPSLLQQQLHFYLLGLLSSFQHTSTTPTLQTKEVFTHFLNTISNNSIIKQLLKQLRLELQTSICLEYPELPQSDCFILSKNQIKRIAKDYIDEAIKQKNNLTSSPRPSYEEEKGNKDQDQNEDKIDILAQLRLQSPRKEPTIKIEDYHYINHKQGHSSFEHNQFLEPQSQIKIQEIENHFDPQKHQKPKQNQTLQTLEDEPSPQISKLKLKEEEHQQTISTQKHRKNISSLVRPFNPSTFLKVEPHLQNKAPQDSQRFGHFLYGDKPKQIMQIFLLYDQLFGTVSWKERLDGVTPQTSHLSLRQIQEGSPQMVIVAYRDFLNDYKVKKEAEEKKLMKQQQVLECKQEHKDKHKGVKKQRSKKKTRGPYYCY